MGRKAHSGAVASAHYREYDSHTKQCATTYQGRNVMKKCITTACKASVVVLGVMLSTSAYSAPVTTVGHLSGSGVVVDQVDYYSGSTYVYTVDFYSFSSTGGAATFDVWAYDYEDTYLNPEIYVFRDDGDLGADDIIAKNDDWASSHGTGWSDGTSNAWDSYLSDDFTAGDYLFAIAQSGVEIDDIIDGVFGGTPDDKVGDYIGLNYQVTYSGIEVTQTPLPATAWFFITGVAGFAGLRKRQALKQAS